MSYELLAAAVDNLSTNVATLTQGAQEAIQRVASLTKVNTTFPFNFIPGTLQYDVRAISGDPAMTTAGMALWVEGSIVYPQVDNTTKFTLLDAYLYNDTTSFLLIGNARFDEGLNSLQAAYNGEKVARTLDYYSYLNKLELEPAVAYVTGLTIERPTQTVTQAGVRYRPKATALPVATTNWTADASKFLPAEDMSLRQEVVNKTDPALGSGIMGHKRSRLAGAIATAGHMLSAQCLNIWEFSYLVTNKPDALDPDTWDWLPAYQGAIDFTVISPLKTIYSPSGDYPLSGPFYLRDKVVILGAGNAATRLRPMGDYDCVRVWTDYVGGTGINRAGLRDLMIFPLSNSGLTYTVGRAIHAKTSTTGSSKVWKLMLDNIQIYQMGGTGLYLEGNSNASIAETLITNFEAKLCGENGIWENQYVFDTWLGQALVEDCKLFGARLQGGSATILHLHAVACGSNDGVGGLTGGGFSIKGNYYDLINCHADRNYGHGFIIGGFGAEDLARYNRLTDCISFNNGNTTGTKIGRNMQVGAVRDLKVIGGFFGNIGSTLLTNNVYGVDFVSPNTFQVDFIGTHFRGNQTQAVLFGGVVPAGEVSFTNTSFDGNTSITNNYAKAEWVACNGTVNKHIYNTTTWHGISSALSFDSTLIAGLSIDPLGEIKISRSGFAALQLQRNGGNGVIQEFWRANVKVGEIIVNTAGTQFGSASAAWSQPPLKLGGYYLWIDSTGQLRIKSGMPANETDGTIFTTDVAVPASATAPGIKGQRASDDAYQYTCTATNVWRRVAHAAW